MKSLSVNATLKMLKIITMSHSWYYIR